MKLVILNDEGINLCTVAEGVEGIDFKNNDQLAAFFNEVATAIVMTREGEPYDNIVHNYELINLAKGEGNR